MANLQKLKTQSAENKKSAKYQISTKYMNVSIA